MNMTNGLSILLLVVFAPLSVINLFLSLELAAGLVRSRLPRSTSGESDTVILVPAHNEEAGIGATLERLRPALSSWMRVLVIADNCTDQTARIAREHGAQVIERKDAESRGKGYALAFARDHLRLAAPASVIIFDADCHSDRASLANLVAHSQSSDSTTQAVYLFEPDPTASPMVQISNFAFLLRNLVRQRGLQRLAGRVHLTGTGMCLPWPHFAAADLATANIVEDLQLGIDLAESGVPPLLIEDATVWSRHAAVDQTLVQRSRWEGGFLATMRATVPRQLQRAVQTGSLSTLLAALDLMVPPLALLVLINVACLAVTVSLSLLGLINWVPGGWLLLTGALVAILVIVTWYREGRTTLRGGALLKAPLYVLWKVPMYAGLVSSGAPKHWTRTGRGTETERKGSSPID